LNWERAEEYRIACKY